MEDTYTKNASMSDHIQCSQKSQSFGNLAVVKSTYRYTHLSERDWLIVLKEVFVHLELIWLNSAARFLKRLEVKIR